MIEDLLRDKPKEERANLKSIELAKVKLSKFTKLNFDIEIIGDIKTIEGGIELFAKAFRGTKQLGFGKDGTVEIERFIFHNPPVLVDDPTGDIIKEYEDFDTKEIKQRKLKYDPEEVIKQILYKTILKVGQEDTNIVVGKIGTTTSTFYPSMDGDVLYANSTDTGWNTSHDSTDYGPSGGLDYTGDTMRGAFIYYYTSNGAPQIGRGFLLFDTSALGDDTIDSATISVNCTSDPTVGGGETYHNACVFASTPASDTALVTGDFDQVGSVDTPTKFSDEIAIALGTMTFTLNATGEAAIDGSGTSKFGTRNEWDYGDHVPSSSDAFRSYCIYNQSEVTGTTNDPTLTVEHTSLTNGGEFFNIF